MASLLAIAACASAVEKWNFATPYNEKEYLTINDQAFAKELAESTNGAIEITETMQKAGAFHVFRRDTGIKREFQQKLGAVLKPGCAALAVLGYGTDREAIAATVSKWKGQVVTSDLDDDAEAELRMALAKSKPSTS